MPKDVILTSVARTSMWVTRPRCIQVAGEVIPIRTELRTLIIILDRLCGATILRITLPAYSISKSAVMAAIVATTAVITAMPAITAATAAVMAAITNRAIVAAV